MPTYSFEEIIELIRTAEDPDHACLIAELVMEEKKQYCLFHLNLIVEAVKLKKEYFKEINPGWF